MEPMMEFIFGGISDPVKLAACFMLFLCVLDAIFGIVNTLLNMNEVRA